jgi:hypothetical protein
VIVVGVLLLIGLVTGSKVYLYAMILAAVIITLGVRSTLLLRGSAPSRREEGYD